MVSFVSEGAIVKLDTYLNILQSVQLPFALVPLLKFVSSERIMKDFALPRCQIIFASSFGLFLFTMNFVIIFSDQSAAMSNPLLFTAVLIGSCIYIGFIITAIREPVKSLK